MSFDTFLFDEIQAIFKVDMWLFKLQDVTRGLMIVKYDKYYVFVTDNLANAALIVFLPLPPKK